LICNIRKLPTNSP